MYRRNFVLEADLEIKGSLTCYFSGSDSGGVLHRYCCTQCGTPLAVKPEAFDGLKAIKASSLDDKAWVQPTMDIFVESKQPWIELPELTEKYEGLSPGS